MRSSIQRGFLISFLLLMAVLMGALPSLTYANGPFIVASPLRASAAVNTASTDVFRFHCDTSWSLTKLWFFGGFNSVSSPAYWEAGTATGTIAVGATTGNLFRSTATFAPQDCTNGYINIKFYRTGTAVTILGSNSAANGWFEGYDKNAIIPNTAVCYSCVNFAQNTPVEIAGLFTYSTSSSDMSTTTIALAYGPIHFALGAMVFLLAVITWVLLTRRNKK